MKVVITILFSLLFSKVIFANGDFRSEAKKILKPIKKAFMKELQVGLKNGPYNAVDSCHLKAPHLIEHDFSSKYQFGRTSNKIRNPQNEPKTWLKNILKEYEGTNIEQKKGPGLYKLDNGKQVYVEPIYLKSVCLQCHGSPKSSVLKRLKKFYPHDRATGYKAGDFRGLFWLKEK